MFTLWHTHFNCVVLMNRKKSGSIFFSWPWKNEAMVTWIYLKQIIISLNWHQQRNKPVKIRSISSKQCVNWYFGEEKMIWFGNEMKSHECHLLTNHTDNNTPPIYPHRSNEKSMIFLVLIFKKIMEKNILRDNFQNFKRKPSTKNQWNWHETQLNSSSMYEYMKCVTSHMTQFSFIKIYSTTLYCLYVRDFVSLLLLLFVLFCFCAWADEEKKTLTWKFQ